MGFFPSQEYTHVVVGIIQNDHHEVLVSRRPVNTHLQGLLEFPGGKTEINELPIDALKRELSEELGIQVLQALPLIQIPFIYSDRNVMLEVFCIQEYTGEIIANEGQDLSWRPVESLMDTDFPAANYGIIRALKFPKVFPITPDCMNENKFLKRFEKVISRSDIKIIQFRSHKLSNLKYIELTKECIDLCELYKVKLILNRELACIKKLDFSGIHLTSKNLLELNERPLGSECIVGASCHNAVEVEKANALKLDYILIGPVLEKVQHTEAKILQWDGFTNLSSMSLIPVYAIGGMQLKYLDACARSGGQGIAAIRALWE